MRVTCKCWLAAISGAVALLVIATPAAAQLMPSQYRLVGYYKPFGFGRGVFTPLAVYDQEYEKARSSHQLPGFQSIGYGDRIYVTNDGTNNCPNMTFPAYATSSGAASYPVFAAYNPATHSTSYFTTLTSASTNPYASITTSSLTTTSSPGAALQVGDLYTNPYTSNPYAAYYNPTGSYLSGAGDFVTARGNYLIAYQRAYLCQEEAHRSMLDSRRKMWEEARYERASLMNSEQVRLANIESALDRARHDPPLNEIWSAQALNSLLDYLTAQQGKSGQGPEVALNDETLQHINLTTGKDGNAGLLKSDLRWPATLMRPEFNDLRKQLDNQLPEAVRQAKTAGKVKADLPRDIKANVGQMQDVLLQHVSDIQPNDYVTAKKYLNMLQESAKALNDPNVTNYFNDKWTAKGNKTVGDLIDSLKRSGLRFAPAAPGDEAAYRALYDALRDYDAGMAQLTSTPTQQP